MAGGWTFPYPELANSAFAKSEETLFVSRCYAVEAVFPDFLSLWSLWWRGPPGVFRRCPVFAGLGLGVLLLLGSAALWS